MSDDRRNENDQIYDLPALSPNADINEIREHLQRLSQWTRSREPVGDGSFYIKFLTYGALERLGLIEFQDGTEEPKQPETVVKTVAYYARDMRPSITNGCAALATIETDPTHPIQTTLDFDASAQESAEFTAVMPRDWVGRAFQFRIYWSHGPTAGPYGVVWHFQANSLTDGELIAIAIGGSTLVPDTGGAAHTLYITAESEPAVIKSEYNSEGDLVFIRILREPSHAADTLPIDAKLHAIVFNLSETPVAPAVYGDLSSMLYPLEAMDELDASPGSLEGYLVDAMGAIDVHAGIYSGTLDVAISYKSITADPESLDVSAGPSVGTLTLVITFKSITADPESLDVSAGISSGTLPVVINYVSHTIAPEGLDVSGGLHSGTLT